MAYDRPLPPALANKWGHLRHIRYVGNGEWHSECPVCGDAGHNPNSGDPDRFFMNEADARYEARGKCRRCGHFEWADERKPITVEQVARIKKVEEIRREEAEREANRIRAMIEEMNETRYWQGWHDHMTADERKLWEAEGITNDLQDWFCLGYAPDKPYTSSGETYRSPALTIPYRYFGGISNVQFRLCNPVNKNDRYRFTHGLPATPFIPDPDPPPSGSCLLVEGAKKAMITWARIGHRVNHVIGLPSKTYYKLDCLKDFDTIYLVLDPDADTDGDESSPCSNEKMANVLGIERTIVTVLPMKIDDMIVQGSLNEKKLWSIIRQGRRYT